MEFSRDLEEISDGLSLHVPDLKLTMWERALQSGRSRRQQTPSPGMPDGDGPLECGRSLWSGAHHGQRGWSYTNWLSQRGKPPVSLRAFSFSGAHLGITGTETPPERVFLPLPPEFQCCLRGAPWAAESSSMDSFIGFLMPSQDDVTQILWNMLGTMDLGTLVKSQRRRGLDQGARQVR